jgi:transposase-like protein
MPRVYESAAVAVQIKLTMLDCASCGMVFGVTTELEKRRREDGKSFFCPNGHSNFFVENELDKARKEVKRLQDESERRRQLWRDEQAAHDATLKSLAATKGHLTRTKKYIAAGVCPYCHRHFSALERHMASKHPDEPAAD